jgi:hypothetical protein
MLVPSKIPLKFFFADEQTPEGKVECYEADIDSYVSQLHQGRPALEVQPIQILERPPQGMTPERFLAGLRATTDAQGSVPLSTSQQSASLPSEQ